MALTVAQFDTAIDEVLTNGQSTTQDGTTYTAANLKTLIDGRDVASREASAADGARPMGRVVNFTTMGYGTS